MECPLLVFSFFCLVSETDHQIISSVQLVGSQHKCVFVFVCVFVCVCVYVYLCVLYVCVCVSFVMYSLSHFCYVVDYLIIPVTDVFILLI